MSTPKKDKQQKKEHKKKKDKKADKDNQQVSFAPAAEDLAYLCPVWWKRGYYGRVQHKQAKEAPPIARIDANWEFVRSPLAVAVTSDYGYGIVARANIPTMTVLDVVRHRDLTGALVTDEVVKVPKLGSRECVPAVGSYEHLLYSYSWGTLLR